MNRVLAAELAEFGIRVNCIAPGFVITKMTEPLDLVNPKSNLGKDNFQKRVATPDEMSGVAAFLGSDDSSYVTGDTVIVDGGRFNRF